MFSKKIIDWYSENGRSLPWRVTSDAYKIWLSEIILQQTRIEQGTSYYLRFVENFPTVCDLAAASEQEVLKLWQGLGYYSRARNLHAAAQYIATELDGRFPDTYEGILKLKGVGRYTAAAIASFAYRLPYPVIDGNVYRLVARLYGISTPIGTDAAYKEFEQLLQHLIDRRRPDLFNQAMMDFGSIYCKPVPVDCETCIFRQECVARREGRVALLPVKAAATAVKERWFYYYHLEWRSDGQTLTLLHQRTKKDIWRGLYEFPLLETDHPLSDKELQQQNNTFFNSLHVTPATKAEVAFSLDHKLTHRTIHATFIHAILPEDSTPNIRNDKPYTAEGLKKLPISRLIDRYLSSMCKKSPAPFGKK